MANRSQDIKTAGRRNDCFLPSLGGRDRTGISSGVCPQAARFFVRMFRRGCNRGLGLRGVEDSNICVANVDLGEKRAGSRLSVIKSY